METAVVAPPSPAPTRAWQKVVAQYAKPNLRRSIWGLVNSFGPYLLLWVAMYYSMRVSYLLTLALAARAVATWTDHAEIVELGAKFTNPVVVPDDDDGVEVVVGGTVVVVVVVEVVVVVVTELQYAMTSSSVGPGGYPGWIPSIQSFSWF